MMRLLKHTGSFKHTEAMLKRCKNLDLDRILHKYGKQGVKALRDRTPRDTGLTAESWYYEIIKIRGVTSLRWCNSHVVDGVKIAVIIQYGHLSGATYISGKDYINPAIKPVMDNISKALQRELRVNG